MPQPPIDLEGTPALGRPEQRAQGEAETGGPVAQAYRAALARRSSSRSPAVQRVLQQRVQSGWPKVAAGAITQARACAGMEPDTTSPAGCTSAPAGRPHHAAVRSLAPLLRYIDERSAQLAASDGLAAPADPPTMAGAARELRALAQAGPAWAQLRLQQQLQQSLAQAPERAGPLNSHGLVLRTLQTLQVLSPAYLLRFMDQMDILFMLDHLQAQGPPGATANKPPRRAAPTSARRARPG